MYLCIRKSFACRQTPGNEAQKKQLRKEIECIDNCAAAAAPCPKKCAQSSFATLLHYYNGSLVLVFVHYKVFRTLLLRATKIPDDNWSCLTEFDTRPQCGGTVCAVTEISITNAGLPLNFFVAIIFCPI